MKKARKVPGDNMNGTAFVHGIPINVLVIECEKRLPL